MAATISHLLRWAVCAALVCFAVAQVTIPTYYTTGTSSSYGSCDLAFSHDIGYTFTGRTFTRIYMKFYMGYATTFSSISLTSSTPAIQGLTTTINQLSSSGIWEIQGTFNTIDASVNPISAVFTFQYTAVNSIRISASNSTHAVIVWTLDNAASSTSNYGDVRTRFLFAYLNPSEIIEARQYGQISDPPSITLNGGALINFTPASVQTMTPGTTEYYTVTFPASTTLQSTCLQQPGPSSPDTGLTGGQIAGIVIGSIFGFLCIIAGFVKCCSGTGHGSTRGGGSSYSGAAYGGSSSSGDSGGYSGDGGGGDGGGGDGGGGGGGDGGGGGGD